MTPPDKWRDNRIPPMKMLFLFFILVVPSLTIDGCQKLSNLTDFKYRMQEKVRAISDALVQQYRNICSPAIQQCTSKSYDLCQGTGVRECLHNFPSNSQCLGSGIVLAKTSGVRLPNVLNKNNLTANAKKFICASALIQQVFQDHIKNNAIDYSYAYIGSSSGSIRVAPGFKQQINPSNEQCANYDPRKRPWYVSAITGSKTTIILFDISRTMTSMHPGMRFANAKVTLEIIFETLNSFDYVGVVAFSGTATAITFDKIKSASEQNKKKIVQDIQALATGLGTTNYTAAIQMGMKMLQNVSTACQDTAETVFLLLTDGYTENDRPEPIEIFNSLIQTKFKQMGKSMENFKLISFVYGVQENIDYDIVKKLTCKYNGIVFRIWDGIDEYAMVEKLTSYYIFLSEGINQSQIKPLWSDFYQDAFGFGTIVTVTIPIYVEGTINKIIGVAGIDVLFSKFQECGYDLDYVGAQLKHKPRCFKSSLNPSELLYLRCKQGNVICTNDSCSNLNQTTDFVCSASISNSVFKPAVDNYNDQERCCLISIQKFIAIVLSCGLSVITLTIVIVLYKKGYLHKLKEKCKKPNANVESDDGSKVSLLNDHNLLLDPMKKYKEAEESGIKIYRQPQFVL